MRDYTCYDSSILNQCKIPIDPAKNQMSTRQGHEGAAGRHVLVKAGSFE